MVLIEHHIAFMRGWNLQIISQQRWSNRAKSIEKLKIWLRLFGKHWNLNCFHSIRVDRRKVFFGNALTRASLRQRATLKSQQPIFAAINFLSFSFTADSWADCWHVHSHLRSAIAFVITIVYRRRQKPLRLESSRSTFEPVKILRKDERRRCMVYDVQNYCEGKFAY